MTPSHQPPFPGCQDHKYCCKSCEDHSEKGSCMFLTRMFDTIGMIPANRTEAYKNGEGVFLNADDRNLIGCLGCLSHSSLRNKSFAIHSDLQMIEALEHVASAESWVAMNAYIAACRKRAENELQNRQECGRE